MRQWTLYHKPAGKVTAYCLGVYKGGENVLLKSPRENWCWSEINTADSFVVFFFFFFLVSYYRKRFKDLMVDLNLFFIPKALSEKSWHPRAELYPCLFTSSQ